MSNIGPKKLPTLRDSKDPEQLDVFQREVREAFRQVARDTADSITNVTNIISSGTGLVNSVTGTGRVNATPVTGDVIVSVDVSDIEADVAALQADVITEVVAGTNLSGGGNSGSVTLDVVDSPTFTGKVTAGNFRHGVMSVALTADQNNWNPAGGPSFPISTYHRVDVTSVVGSPTLITGFDATNASTGDTITITNRSAGQLLFIHQSASSLAANRLTCYSGTGQYLDTAGSISFTYTAGVGWLQTAAVSGIYNGIFNNGAITQLGTFNANGGKFFGNLTIGDTAAQAHVLNGTLNANATAGVNGDILQVTAGVPKWATLASAGLPTGTGTANTLTKWTGANTLGNSAITENGTKVSSSLYVEIARPAGSSPELDFVQAGQATWALYGHGGAGTFALWNQTHGDILFLGPTGDAQFNKSLTVINNFATNGNATLGNAVGDILTVNGNVSFFGAGGLIYFSGNQINGEHSSNATGGLNLNFVGYNGGFTQYRDLGVYDGKGGLIIDVDGASKQTDFYGNILARDNLRVLGDLLVDGDMVINDVVNGIITARVLEAEYIFTSPGSGGNIESDGVVTAKSGYNLGDPAGSPTQAFLFIGRQLFTASGTYTPTPETKAVRVRMVGGGGGGGGAQGGNACGGGGASGAYWEKFINVGPGLTGGAVTIGAAGTGGSTAGGNGGTGGDTSVVVQATTYTAKGGLGGVGMLTPAGTFTALGGSKQAGTSAGDVAFQEPGYPSLFINTSFYYAGKGGSSPLGAGGAPTVQTASAAGTVGTGFGAGGSGGQGAAQAGAVGTAGVVIIEEYG